MHTIFKHTFGEDLYTRCNLGVAAVLAEDRYILQLVNLKPSKMPAFRKEETKHTKGSERINAF